MAALAVDLALVLALDCSSSVDAGDFILQKQGIAAALRQQEVLAAITAGASARVALAVVQWSTARKQVISVPWLVLSAREDLEAAAQRTEAFSREGAPGGTGLAAAIAFSSELLLSSPFAAPRRVIDVSGDGRENEGGDVGAARSAAVNRGIVINGLPIISTSQVLEAYYQSQVIGGAGAFHEPATNILAFKAAMQRKLLRELQGPVS